MTDTPESFTDEMQDMLSQAIVKHVGGRDYIILIRGDNDATIILSHYHPSKYETTLLAAAQMVADESLMDDARKTAQVN